MLGNSSPFICSAELQLRNRCPTMYQTSTPHLIVTHTNSKHVVLSCCNLIQPQQNCDDSFSSYSTVEGTSPPYPLNRPESTPKNNATRVKRTPSTLGIAFVISSCHCFFLHVITFFLTAIVAFFSHLSLFFF